MEDGKQDPKVETPVEGQTPETVIKDDKNPLDVLKETVSQSAHELGLSENEISLMTTKELQSYADKAVTQAIKTREERLKKQQEEEKLKQDKKYEELLNMKDAELNHLKLERETLELLNDKPKEFMPLLTAPDIEGRKTQLESLESLINSQVKKRVEEMERGSFKTESKPSEIKPESFKTPEEALTKIFEQQK